MERRHLCKLWQKWNKTECGPAARTDSSWPLQSLAHFLCKCTGIIQTIGFWLHVWQKKWIFHPATKLGLLNGLIIRLWKSGTIFGESFLWWKRLPVGYPVRNAHASGRPPKVLARAGVLTDWRNGKPGINLAGHGPAKVNHNGHGVVLVFRSLKKLQKKHLFTYDLWHV